MRVGAFERIKKCRNFVISHHGALNVAVALNGERTKEHDQSTADTRQDWQSATTSSLFALGGRASGAPQCAATAAPVAMALHAKNKGDNGPRTAVRRKNNKIEKAKHR